MLCSVEAMKKRKKMKNMEWDFFYRQMINDGKEVCYCISVRKMVRKNR